MGGSLPNSPAPNVFQAVRRVSFELILVQEKELARNPSSGGNLHQTTGI